MSYSEKDLESIIEIISKKTGKGNIEKNTVKSVLADLGYSDTEIEEGLLELEQQKIEQAKEKELKQLGKKRVLYYILYFMASLILLGIFLIPSLFFEYKKIDEALTGIIGLAGLIIGAAVAEDSRFLGGVLGTFTGGLLGMGFAFLMSNPAGQIIFVSVYSIGIVFLFFFKAKDYIKEKVI